MLSSGRGSTGRAGSRVNVGSLDMTHCGMPRVPDGRPNAVYPQPDSGPDQR
ncbi:Uncharacterised protein [Mycobacteroides abscessus subsp. abscessus]|nr:Uncharacterised protein [Mycobacteroides abscessus subsp. abscessus]